MISEKTNGIEVFILENELLRVSVAPALGGKILSVYNKPLGKEFLWTNKQLQPTIHEAGADYDSNFFGGIDELIPNDIPEIINGIPYPDHGELWTAKLQQEIDGESIRVYGLLPLSGLHYSKSLVLDPSSPVIQLTYTIRNDSGERRNFLWKLHAALNIEAGDRLVTSARQAQVVDPEYSRFKKEPNAFEWPHIENTDASILPAKEGTMDFFYLYDTEKGEMQLVSKSGHVFSYLYDKKVFPYEWLFASYGGFLDHYTAILEPCTNMPISVNDAKQLGQSATLDAGESLTTSVSIFAGEKKNYIDK
jgi:hypothetical protein